MRPNILCLETSAAKCSAALLQGDSKSIYKEAEVAFSHVAQITLLIKDLVAESGLSFDDLDAVAISGGPGSYTGLRVGTSTAKGICFANDIPLIALDTLKVIGHSLIGMEIQYQQALYVSIIDARRDEVYMAGYDKDLTQLLDTQAYILTEDSFKEESKNYEQVIIGGDAVTKAKALIGSKGIIYKEIIPDAGIMCQLALAAFKEQNFAYLSSYTPSYLKPPNITVSKKQFFRKN